MKKIISIVICVLMLAALLGGCGAAVKSAENAIAYDEAYSGDEYGYSDNYSYAATEEANYKGYSNDTAAEKPASDGSEGSADYMAIADAAARKLIRDASLSIQTVNYDEFNSKLESQIKATGGYIESSDSSGNNYYYSSMRSEEITVRIPADKFDTFISSVSGIATITSKNVSVRDVTGSYVDTQSRIKALETERDALLAILAKATTVEDLITVQSRITEVNTSLESYKAQIKTYDELISYSTIRLSVNEVERVTETEKLGFFSEIRSRLSDNLYSIGQGLRSFAIWFISSIPYIVVFAVITVIVVLIVKRRVKKHRAKKAERKAKAVED